MFEQSIKFRRAALWAGLIVLLAAIGTGIHARQSLARSCEVQAVQEAASVLVSQMRMYDDVYVSAANGTRTSLEYPLTVMQETLMDTQQVEVPTCLQTAKDELVNYMAGALRAFRAFTAGEPETTIQGHLDDSYTHVRIFLTELEAVRKCAPLCIR